MKNIICSVLVFVVLSPMLSSQEIVEPEKFEPALIKDELIKKYEKFNGKFSEQTVELWDTYFLKVDKVKFKQKVIPGDTLVIKLELLEPIRRGIVHMFGTIYVGSSIVSEGELTAQIVKR